jgi:alkanesulfonate monooxygenase SsuD/methylene tetrahydromethanopterin reductase-like flavin-dependent oxidoreductase (luciferase family)
MPSNRIVGDPAHVAMALDELVERTAADEIMISTMTYGFAERARTLELVAP